MRSADAAKIATLNPVFQPYAKIILNWLMQQDPNFYVTSARRSLADQTRLYKTQQLCQASPSCRAQQVNPFPVAKPGCSMHEAGLAIDIARPEFQGVYYDSLRADRNLRAIGQAWRRAGGFWDESDPIHFAWSKGICA